MVRDYERIKRMRETEGMSWKDIALQEGENENTLRGGFSRWKRQQGDAAIRTLEDRLPDMVWPEEIDWRDLLDLWDQSLKLHKKLDPTIEMFTLDMSDIEEPIAIVSASDLHLGGGFTDHQELRKTMDLILKSKHLYLGITGDSIEGFLPGFRAAEAVEQQVSSIKSQLAALRSLTTELTNEGKLLWMGWGDHDALWFEKEIGLNIVKQDVHKIVPYFQGRGLMRLLLNEQEYWIQANHKERWSSQYNATHPARRAYGEYFPADVTITGHLHHPAFHMEHHYSNLRRAGINLGGKAWFIQNGTFKTGPDTYTIRGWQRGILGVPTIVFNPDEHDCDVFDDPAKALAFMRGLNG